MYLRSSWLFKELICSRSNIFIVIRKDSFLPWDCFPWAHLSLMHVFRSSGPICILNMPSRRTENRTPAGRQGLGPRRAAGVEKIPSHAAVGTHPGPSQAEPLNVGSLQCYLSTPSFGEHVMPQDHMHPHPCHHPTSYPTSEKAYDKSQSVFL